MEAIILLAVFAVLALTKSSGGSVVSDNVTPWNRYDSLIQKYVAGTSVPFDWVKAIMIIESDLGRAPSVARGILNPTNVDASKSSDGKSWGLMQLTLPTARMFEPLITEVGLNDPEISIRLGVKYLKWLISKKGLDQEYIARSYNGGLGWPNSSTGRNMTAVYYSKFLLALDRVRANKG